MSLSNTFSQFQTRQDEPVAGPELVHTHWGYRLHTADFDEGLPRFGRAIGRFVGLVLLLVIAGIWSYSANTFADPLMMSMKLGMTGLLFVFGWLLFWFGRDTSRPEAQIDLNHREIRIGRSDRLGRFNLDTRVTFSEVGSVLILRDADTTGKSGLYARIGSGMDAFEIISGQEDVLEPIQNRLVQDLTTARRTVRNKSAWPSLSGEGSVSLARVSAS